MKIEGGYLFRGRNELSRLIALISSRKLSLAEARVFIVSIEMRSIRDAAKALKGKRKEGRGVIPNYQANEIKKLSGLSSRKISAAKKNLAKLGFVLFSENKGDLPLPRRLIRFLGKCEKRSVFLVLLSYIERGLSLRSHQVKNAGSIKAALISQKTGLSLRAVKLARKELLCLGIITPDTTKYQRKLNRDGAYFTVNLSWNDNKNKVLVINRKGSEGTMKSPVAEKVPVGNSQPTQRQIAPPPIKNCSQIAPPYRNKKSSYEFRNQKSQASASNPSGVFTKQEKKSGGEGKVLLPPTIKNVLRVDLENFGRCEDLYFQAAKKNLIEASEAGAINFLAAAVRAKSVSGDAPRIFMGIIRKKLWKNITQADEDRALAALKRFRADNPDRFRLTA